MGLLKKGAPLHWQDTDDELRRYVKKHGVIQFLNIYKDKTKSSRNEILKWGDEVEYMVIKKDPQNKKVYLSLRGHAMVDEFTKQEEEYLALSEEEKKAVAKPVGSYRPEYGRYMVEGTPFEPYLGCMKCLLETERSMQLRRAQIQSICAPNENVVTLSMFPLMGAVPDLTDPLTAVGGPISESLFLPDCIMNPHPRFGTLTGNIRQRRGAKVQILMPLYVDKNTDRNIGSRVPWSKDMEKLLSVDPHMVMCSPTLFFSASTAQSGVGGSNGLGGGTSINISPSSPCLESLERAAVATVFDNSVKDGDAASSDGEVESPNNDMNASFASSSCDHQEIELPERPASRCTIEEGDKEDEERDWADLCPNNHPAIYMDAMGFGMGCCCLQCTFQADNIDEARRLYDQLLVLCPVMLSITASTPIVRGLLADSDVRWNIVSQSVDDRTPEEQVAISKSRYDSASLYIAENEEAKKYSDLDIVYDKETYDTLIANGIDDRLAHHVSHLFIRDPLVIFDDALHVDDETESDHFENIQSTNWQTVRFKPPPPQSDIGWRVEFRVMEVQFTDFENAAFMVLIPLITRAILSYNLNLYMPISLVDRNMKKAHRRDSVLTQKFWFRTRISPRSQQHEHDSAKSSANGGSTYAANAGEDEGEVGLFREMSINEIMNGTEDGSFEGILTWVTKYLDDMNMDVDVRMRLNRYVELVSRRASGDLMTTAAYMRKFVTSHPSYKQDSVVTNDIAYDLVRMAEDIASGKLHAPELLDNLNTPLEVADSAGTKCSDGVAKKRDE